MHSRKMGPRLRNLRSLTFLGASEATRSTTNHYQIIIVLGFWTNRKSQKSVHAVWGVGGVYLDMDQCIYSIQDYKNGLPRCEDRTLSLLTLLASCIKPDRSDQTPTIVKVRIVTQFRARYGIVKLENTTNEGVM